MTTFPFCQPPLRRGVLTLALALSSALSEVGAGIFHVVPDGRSGPGLFSSIQAAVEASRKVAGPHTIVVGAGRFFNDSPVRLDDRDSGLTIKGAKPGAVAEVYGGVPVTGWEKWKDWIWRARVPQGKRFFNLIVDGKPATMAQTPNEGGGFGGGAEKRGNEAILLPPELRGYDFSDAQVFTFIGANWFAEMREVLAVSPDAQGVLAIDGGRAGLNAMNERFFLRGVLEFLDEPGEWCLRHKEGYVYYWPKTGTPDDHVIVRPTVQRLFEVMGRNPETPAKGITIENMSLVGSDFCVRWYLFPSDANNSTPEPLQQGLVFGENVDRLGLRNCRILAAGHSGVWFNHHAVDCVVENCLIIGAGFAGVFANGYVPGEGPFQSAAESDVNKGHRIENNFIHGCGKFVGHGCGIQFFQSGNALITRNEIGEMPRYGISYKGSGYIIGQEFYGKPAPFGTHYEFIHSRNLKITGNEIYSVCRNSYDFGGIECFFPGRNNLWAGNDLHDIDQAVEWDGWAHVLFADDASDHLTISGNIIHHCNGGRFTGATMVKSVEQNVENNLVVDCNMGRLVTFEAAGVPLWNNRIAHNMFAVDGAVTRYGYVSEQSLKGKGTDHVKVPDGASGFTEIDHNWITPRDPANANPVANFKMDLNSTFGPAPVERRKPDWDATAADYVVTDRPGWFQPIDASQIGLKKDFPFDTRAATRRLATDKIQAEEYQRTSVARTIGGFGINNLQPGAWTKYANIDFGKGVRKAVFQLDAPPADANAPKRFVRKTGDTVVEAVPFRSDSSVETVPQWEISKPYTQAGKTGAALFDIGFPPESDPKAGEWSLLLQPATSKGGQTAEQGVVDFHVAGGETATNACAYARASIHAQSGRTNATMTLETTGGAKVWLNGELVISSSKPGTFSETAKGILKEGWNTVLVKVNQLEGPGKFSFKFGTVTSACGKVVALPGLPDRAEQSGTYADAIVRLCVDSPEGPVIGQLGKGETECQVKDASGVRNLYLVFPGGEVRWVDWLRFER